MARSWAVIAFAYALALAVGWAAARAAADLGPLYAALVGDVAATVAVFAVSIAVRNSSVYDPYWSVAPAALAAYWLADPATELGDPGRQVLVVALLWMWGVRLTWNWARGWTGLGHEDWRYVELKAKHGRLYWIVSFFGIHLFPTVLVALGCLSVWVALEGSAGLDPAAYVGFAIALGATALEAVADEQLRAWRARPDGATRPIDTGLWRYSRHPNYFGECAFWWGLAVMALGAQPTAWWVLAGPVAITLLFVFVSIPMMEARLVARRPAYAERQRTTSAFVPLPPRG